jgi:hypothetical protein
MTGAKGFCTCFFPKDNDFLVVFFKRYDIVKDAIPRTPPSATP